ncbi:glycosyltransferase [Faecalibacter bovis]|uniref:Streptomycin biosynthesis protein StrF domain-containing protein n=1 Tax=Faecalibacter bovis TaxID=2898187 RepID=A0ABX7X9K9_9FLAO|nr:glycosyltransferase [Faecalibacter bovis]QTV04559.1 hypothetical protein J9309_06950 [Faecalibacter bovis]
MLSIIVSSYQKQYFDQFSQNVESTIGENFEFEIIKVWNPGLMGICEAYNKGAEKSKYDNLLFIHEDVLFETENWGEILVDYLKIENVGCIGLAGANYIPNVPSSWWVLEGYKNSHISHYNSESKKRYNYTFKSDNTGLLPTKILDGVFLACKKEVWRRTTFNEKLKGFHGYDIGFSLDINNKFDNYLTNKIDLVHFSSGKLTIDWIKDIIKIYQISNWYQNTIDKDLELKCFKYFGDQLRNFRFSSTEKEYYLNLFISIRHLGLLNWVKARRKIKALKKYNGL